MSKKMLLTSNGITSDKLEEEFKKLFDKKMRDLKMLYIPVAADVEDDSEEWIEDELSHLYDLGIDRNNITEYRFEYDIDVNDFDFIYMLGGSTYYLLKKVRESSFDKKIIQALENEVLYVGSSAGSILLGLFVSTDWTENTYVNDLSGLKLFDGYIYPHADKRKEYVQSEKEKYKDLLYPIEDGHAILIIDDDIHII